MLIKESAAKAHQIGQRFENMYEKNIFFNTLCQELLSSCKGHAKSPDTWNEIPEEVLESFVNSSMAIGFLLTPPSRNPILS